MTDRQLDRLLKRAAQPQWPAEHWETFSADVVRRLGQPRGMSLETQSSARTLFRRWGVAGGIGCIVLAMMLALNSRRNIDAQQDLAQARKLLAEIASLFPNQIRAIVVENAKTQLVLSDRPDIPATVPLFVRICDSSGCERVITFSGQQISLNGEMCDVLLDARGNVIIAGPHFVWSSASKRIAGRNLRINAEALEAL